MTHGTMFDKVSTYEGKDTPPGKGVTSLMIRNLPKSYTEDIFLSQFENAFGTACVDFLYMPWNVKRDCNIGYAFVNFKEEAVALEFFLKNSCQRWTLEDASRPCCRIATAHVQGLAANLEHFVKMAVDLPQCRRDPIVYLDGIRVDLSVALPLMAPGAVTSNSVHATVLPSQQKSKTIRQPKAKHQRQNRGMGAVQASGTSGGLRSADFSTSDYATDQMMHSQVSSAAAEMHAAHGKQVAAERVARLLVSERLHNPEPCDFGYGAEEISRFVELSSKGATHPQENAQMAKRHMARSLPDEGNRATPGPVHRLCTTQQSGCLTPPGQYGSSWSSCSTRSSETANPSHVATRDQYIGVRFSM